MSFDIALVCKCCGATLHAPEKFEEGGTYPVGGWQICDLNVTYNYAPHFGYRALDGRTGEETIPELEAAVAKLGTDAGPDYWAPTPGNAGAACARLLSFAKHKPQGVWRVY